MRIQIGTGKAKWFTSDSENAQAFYRLWPFAYLNGVTIVEEPTVSVASLSKTDVVVFHQPIQPDCLQYVSLCKQMGKKVWVDMDDLVLENSVPPCNPAAQYFRPKGVQDTLRLCVLAADVVSVTTKTLKDALVQWWGVTADKVHIIPNALPDELWARRMPYCAPKERTRIAWRGSITHEGDLFLCRDAFKDYANIDFVFFGHEPWPLYQRYGGQLTKALLRDWVPGMLKYMQAVAEEAPNYGIVVLENIPFNHAKSNIAMLEFAWAGCPTIAPAYMPEFNGTGCVTFGNENAKIGSHYVHDLTQLFKEIDARKHDAEAAYAAIVKTVEDRYLLSTVNKQRQSIVNQLFTSNG